MLRLFCLFTLLFVASAQAEVRVLTSIKPLQLIAAAVQDGIGSPDVLLPPGASPHHYALRPSDVRRVRDADLLYWIGPDMEAFLPRVLGSRDKPQVAVQDLPGMTLRHFGDSHSHDEHEHDEHDHGHEHASDDLGHDHDHRPGSLDAHLWLAADNAKVIAARMAADLAKLDAANAARYAANLQAFEARLDALDGRIRPQLATPLRKLLRTGNLIDHSPAVVPSRWPERINASDADLVHLHWVQKEMLSIADIGRIRKPIVWTLHDMWAFCGAEHYTADHRWRDGYWRDNRPAHESGFDLNRFTWERKRKHWRRPLHIVGDSYWISDCASNSLLMRDWPVTTIHYSLDTNSWQPIDQPLARQLMDLPQDCPILLFGATSGGTDPRKGFDLLLTALAQLGSEPSLQSMQLVVFGQLAPQSPPQLGFPVHYTGHLHDDLSLRALYSAADVMVVPSRQEAFGQTASEAHACGTPVVAFNTGGLPDIVDDRVTGALAEPFEPGSLAAAICWVLEDSQRRQQLGAAARARAERLWAPARVARLYSQVYEMAIELTAQALKS